MDILIERSRAKQRLTATLEMEPLIDEEFSWIIDAFLLLSNYRPRGESWVGFISISEIKAYADYHDLTPKEKDYFLQSIAQMDTVYIERMMKTAAKKSGESVDGPKI